MARTHTPQERRQRLAAQLAELTERRERLAERLAVVEAEWSIALAESGDTRKATSARRTLLDELSDTDSEIGRVTGWLAEVDAELARELAEVRYRELAEEYGRVSARFAEVADDYAEAVEEAVAAAAASTRDLVAGRRELEQTHAQLESLAAGIAQSARELYGAADGPVVAPLPVAPPAVFEAGRLVLHRVFDAAARATGPSVVDTANTGRGLVAHSLGQAAAEEIRLGRA